MNFYSVFLCSVLALSACVHSDEMFVTKKIPNAKIGELYDEEIELKEIRVVESLFLIDSNIDESDGIEVIQNMGENEDTSFSKILLQGTPKKDGTYYIKISGVARANNQEFEKKFELKVIK